MKLIKMILESLYKKDKKDLIMEHDGMFYEITSNKIKVNLDSLIADNDIARQVKAFKNQRERRLYETDTTDHKDE